MKKAVLQGEDKGKDLLFGDIEPERPAVVSKDSPEKAVTKPWKVMVIDDDDVVHQVTFMVLADYTFEGQQVELIQGYSGGACRTLMKKHPDTALLLLDVVMETDSAGLDTVRYIRDELCNQTVQIILRTGQPGQAPEQDVVGKYDINGYVRKTDLTAQKLYSCISTALADYRDKNSSEASDVA